MLPSRKRDSLGASSTPSSLYYRAKPSGFSKSPSAATTSSAVSVPKFCSLCRATIPESSPYKSCLRCRTKKKEQRVRKNQEKARKKQEEQDRWVKEQVAAAMAILDFDGMPTLSSSDEDRPKKKQKTGHSHSRRYEEKPVRSLPDSDAPLSDKIAAYVKARRASEGSDNLVCNPGNQQTSIELHDALAAAVKEYYRSHASRASAASPITFRGCYSIVMDPAISHSRRVELEASQVQKIDKLPHGRSSYGYSVSKDSYKRTVPCNCHDGLPRRVAAPAVPIVSAPTPPHTSSGSSSKVGKNKQGPLSRWIIRQGSKDAIARAVPKHASIPGILDAGLMTTPYPPSAPISTVSACGGSVTIIAMDDLSHPLGLRCKGQKIVITIEHPMGSH